MSIKPGHPHLTACSSKECQTMVDISSVKTIGIITAKMNEKIQQCIKDNSEKTLLLIEVVKLKAKNDLLYEMQQLKESVSTVHDSERLTLAIAKEREEMSAKYMALDSKMEQQYSRLEKNLQSLEKNLNNLIREWNAHE